MQDDLFGLRFLDPKNTERLKKTDSFREKPAFFKDDAIQLSSDLEKFNNNAYLQTQPQIEITLPVL